jgi:hypothetical protein
MIPHSTENPQTKTKIKFEKTRAFIREGKNKIANGFGNTSQKPGCVGHEIVRMPVSLANVTNAPSKHGEYTLLQDIDAHTNTPQ